MRLQAVNSKTSLKEQYVRNGRLVNLYSKHLGGSISPELDSKSAQLEIVQLTLLGLGAQSEGERWFWL